jgi:hypothetical protein
MVFGEIYGGFVAFEVSLLIDSFLNGSWNVGWYDGIRFNEDEALVCGNVKGPLFTNYEPEWKFLGLI